MWAVAVAASTIKDIAEELHLDWHSGEGAREAVHAGAAATGGDAGAEGDRHRRDLDQEAPRLPHPGERPGPGAADLVRGPGSLRGEHGRVLQVARAQEERGDSHGGDGHVEALPNLHPAARPEGQHPLRQVPRAAPPRRGAGHRAQERVRPPLRQGPSLHQGPEVHAALESREPDAGGAQVAQAAARREQAPQHRLPAQGVLRPALGLHPRRLGPALLRELARRRSSGNASSPTRSSRR